MATTEFRDTAAFPEEPKNSPADRGPDAGAKNRDSRLLTVRESEVMHWVKMGKTNHEIGTIMEISAFTVKNHLQRIFKKLEALNRTHAVARYECLDKVVRR